MSLLNEPLKKGTYVVAVSGGVDSMVLLRMLQEQDDLDLVVAHFDHGIRSDSAVDASFVENYCKLNSLKFETSRAELGPDASELLARDSRYEFLNKVKTKHKAQAIITAHHRDDLLETVVINTIRGTGRRGFSSLASTEGLMRPLLHLGKNDLIDYAVTRGLEWQEDSTNKDVKFLRNKIRSNTMPRLVATGRMSEFEAAVDSVLDVNQKIDAEIELLAEQLELLQQDQIVLPRYFMTMVGKVPAIEIVAYLLRKKQGLYLDQKRYTLLYRFIRCGQIGKKCDLHPGLVFVSTKDSIVIYPNSKIPRAQSPGRFIQTSD